MKKIYIAPELEVVKIKTACLLAGSPDLNGGDYQGGDPVLSPEQTDFVIGTLNLFE